MRPERISLPPVNYAPEGQSLLREISFSFCSFSHQGMRYVLLQSCYTLSKHSMTRHYWSCCVNLMEILDFFLRSFARCNRDCVLKKMFLNSCMLLIFVYSSHTSTTVWNNGWGRNWLDRYVNYHVETKTFLWISYFCKHLLEHNLRYKHW